MSVNLYADWKAAFGPGPLMVGEVVEYEDGVGTIELPGGGRLRARGQATLGSKVWVQDGVIQGPAPDLPVDSAAI